jgi:sugar lactone lactonase YvrE
MTLHKITGLALCLHLLACSNSSNPTPPDPPDGAGGSGGQSAGGSGGQSAGGSGGRGGAGGAAATGGSGGAAGGGVDAGGVDAGAGGSGGATAATDAGARPDGGPAGIPDGGPVRGDGTLASALATKSEVVARLPGFPEGPAARASDGSIVVCASLITNFKIDDADKERGSLVRVAPDRKVYKLLSVNCLGAVVLGDNSILLTGPDGLVQVGANGKVSQLAAAPNANDLTVDKAGIVYFTAEDGIHRFTPAGKHDVLLPAAEANGIEVDPANQFLYVTGKKMIRRFALPAADAQLGAATELFPELPVPDGLAFDAEGRLWVALHEASQIGVFDVKAGKELGRLEVPIMSSNPIARRIQNLAFGGPKHDELFVAGGAYMPNAVLVRVPVGIPGFKTNPGAASYKAARELAITATDTLLP